MAAEAPSTNGGSLAAMLEQQHARDEAHKPTVEDVVDEEDLKHPPPAAPKVEPTPSASEPTASAPVPKPAPKKPTFDVQSEELFPALGSGPKPAAPAAATWGAKKTGAAAVANGSPAQSMGT
jgi:hypothetical protein